MACATRTDDALRGPSITRRGRITENWSVQPPVLQRRRAADGFPEWHEASPPVRCLELYSHAAPDRPSVAEWALRLPRPPLRDPTPVQGASAGSTRGLAAQFGPPGPPRARPSRAQVAPGSGGRAGWAPEPACRPTGPLGRSSGQVPPSPDAQRLGVLGGLVQLPGSTPLPGPLAPGWPCGPVLALGQPGPPWLPTGSLGAPRARAPTRPPGPASRPARPGRAAGWRHTPWRPAGTLGASVAVRYARARGYGARRSWAPAEGRGGGHRGPSGR